MPKQGSDCWVPTWAGGNRTQLFFKNLSNDSKGHIKYQAGSAPSEDVHIDKGGKVTREGDFHAIRVHVVNIGETSIDVTSA